MTISYTKMSYQALSSKRLYIDDILQFVDEETKA